MIYTYWENKPGQPVSPLQQLCFDSLKLHNPDFRIVGPSDIRALGGGDVLKFAERVQIPQRSDLVRLWLLAKQGGIWVDADTIATGPIDPRFVEACKEYDLVGYWNPHLRKGWGCDGLLATPFGGPAGSPTLLEGFKRCRDMIEDLNNGKPVPYGQSSVGLLSQLYKQGVGIIYRFEHWRLNPVPWLRARNVFQQKRNTISHEFSSFWNPNACFYHLTNIVPAQFKGATRKQLLEGESFLSFILQKSFGLFPAVPKYTREILKRLPPGSARLVEIGVLRGINGRCLLQQKTDLRYTGVDPWAVLPKTDPDSLKSRLGFGCQRWSRYMKQARRNLAPFDDRVTLYRRKSADAVRRFKNKSVDLVFIDGNHSYAGVVADLRWATKIKPGGWIGGHYYASPKEGKGYGVKRAVDQFAMVNGLKLEVGAGMSWFIRIPRKRLKQLKEGTQ